jgi:VWFA-related protein
MRLLLIVTLVTIATAQQPSAPQPIRSGTQVVEVDVRVLKDGAFVTDLGPADFEIAEDGVPQKIQSVVLITGTPSSASSAPSAPSAPVAPAPSAPSAPLAPSAPSVWVFVFDTAHLTPGPMQRARDAIVTFIDEKFREGDLGGIVVDGKMANNRLTADRASLKQAAAAVKIPGDLRSRQLELREWPRLQDEFEAYRIANNDREAIANAVTRACADDPDACRRSPPDMQVRQKARQLVDGYRVATTQTLNVVNALSAGLARVPGSKTVVFLSEGFVMQGLDQQLRQAAGQAASAGARFYTIDVRGLNTGSGSQIIDQPLVDNAAGAPGRFDMQSDGTNSLAVDTGGFAIRNQNNFGRALDEIQRDAGTYYVVGYAPTNATFDGKYRSISVKVARPNVKVRARRGYLAVTPAALLHSTSAVATKPAAVAEPAAAVPPKPAVGSPEPGRDASPAKAGSGEAKAESGDTGAKAVANLPPRTASATAVMAALGKDEPAARMTPATGSSAAADRGWAAYSQGDLESAVKDLGEAAKAPDARPWVSYALGLAHFALQQPRDATQAWERVRREVPDFEPVYFNLADAYTLQKEDSAALRVLRDAEKRWPQDDEVANAIGVIHVRRGSLDAAIDSFARATTIAPAEALGYFNLARTVQMRLAKSQRYDPQMQKWIGGEEDRRRAIAGFQKYLEIGGPYERQAREALAALAWK